VWAGHEVVIDCPSGCVMADQTVETSSDRKQSCPYVQLYNAVILGIPENHHAMSVVVYLCCRSSFAINSVRRTCNSCQCETALPAGDAQRGVAGSSGYKHELCRDFLWSKSYIGPAVL